MAAPTLAGLVRSLASFLLLQPDGQLVAGFILREASAACLELGNGPRKAASPLGSRTTFNRGKASAGSSFRYAYRRHVLPRRLYLGS